MKDGFDKAKDIAQVAAMVAVPIILAVGGWSIQSTINEREVQRDYLRLAVEVLANPQSESQTQNWARQVLVKYSPVPMSSAVADDFAIRIAAMRFGEAMEELQKNWMRKPPAGRP